MTASESAGCGQLMDMQNGAIAVLHADEEPD
jgi:hypothetical protein